MRPLHHRRLKMVPPPALESGYLDLQSSVLPLELKRVMLELPRGIEPPLQPYKGRVLPLTLKELANRTGFEPVSSAGQAEILDH